MDRTACMITGVPDVQVAYKCARRQLGKVEEIVLDTFLDEFDGFYDRIGFNVPVWWNPPENRGVLTGSKRSLGCPEPYRIDVIAGRGLECELIEVKETGNMTAIGQLLTYKLLFLRNFWGYSKLHLRLVCLRAPEAIRESCRVNGINLSEVGNEAAHLVSQVRRRRQPTSG